MSGARERSRGDPLLLGPLSHPVDVDDAVGDIGQQFGGVQPPERSLGDQPNVEGNAEIQRLLAHHRAIPREAAARAVLRAVETGFVEGLEAGRRHERAAFGRLVASDEGRAGIDRFLARRSLPLPLRRRPLA